MRLMNKVILYLCYQKKTLDLVCLASSMSSKKHGSIIVLTESEWEEGYMTAFVHLSFTEIPYFHLLLGYLRNEAKKQVQSRNVTCIKLWLLASLGRLDFSHNECEWRALTCVKLDVQMCLLCIASEFLARSMASRRSRTLPDRHKPTVRPEVRYWQ
jgi:hypothetical protein